VAYPVVASYDIYESSTNEEDPEITLTFTPASGDLLVWIHCIDALEIFGTPTGFTEVTGFPNAYVDVNVDTKIAYRFCDGTEGATPTYGVTTGNDISIIAVIRITGAADPGTYAPDLNNSTVTNAQNVFTGQVTPTYDSLLMRVAALDDKAFDSTPPGTDVFIYDGAQSALAVVVAEAELGIGTNISVGSSRFDWISNDGAEGYTIAWPTDQSTPGGLSIPVAFMQYQQMVKL
jgi:hypothetical protein